MAADRSRLPDPPLLLITDRRQARQPVEEIVGEALEAGCRWVMLREKDMAPGDQAGLARRLSGLCRSKGATLLVNGAAEAAAIAGNAHLPQGASVGEARKTLGADALIGVSAHSLDEAEAARRLGADYATLSPVFLTDSKPGYGPALGLPGFAAVARRVALPLLALGGIDSGSAAACRHAGAAGFAVMGTVMRSAQPGRSMRSLIEAWRNA
ncbi:MAG: thiamine phosphate synthase [Alphaproteobacteria bacterium]